MLQVIFAEPKLDFSSLECNGRDHPNQHKTIYLLTEIFIYCLTTRSTRIPSFVVTLMK